MWLVLCLGGSQSASVGVVAAARACASTTRCITPVPPASLGVCAWMIWPTLRLGGCVSRPLTPAHTANGLSAGGHVNGAASPSNGASRAREPAPARSPCRHTVQGLVDAGRAGASVARRFHADPRQLMERPRSGRLTGTRLAERQPCLRHPPGIASALPRFFSAAPPPRPRPRTLASCQPFSCCGCVAGAGCATLRCTGRSVVQGKPIPKQTSTGAPPSVPTRQSVRCPPPLWLPVVFGNLDGLARVGGISPGFRPTLRQPLGGRTRRTLRRPCGVRSSPSADG